MKQIEYTIKKYVEAAQNQILSRRAGKLNFTSNSFLVRLSKR